MSQNFLTICSKKHYKKWILIPCVKSHDSEFWEIIKTFAISPLMCYTIILHSKNHQYPLHHMIFKNHLISFGRKLSVTMNSINRKRKRNSEPISDPVDNSRPKLLNVSMNHIAKHHHFEISACTCMIDCFLFFTTILSFT